MTISTSLLSVLGLGEPTKWRIQCVLHPFWLGLAVISVRSIIQRLACIYPHYAQHGDHTHRQLVTSQLASTQFSPQNTHLLKRMDRM